MRAFVAAHAELTAWIKSHPDEACGYLHRGLERITKTQLNAALITTAFKRITFTDAVDRPATQTFVDDAYAIEMLKANPNLDNFFKHARHD